MSSFAQRTTETTGAQHRNPVHVIMAAILLFSPLLFSPLASLADDTALWRQFDAESTVTVNHAPWQQFLDTYLHPAQDGINRVDYVSAAATGRNLLRSYLDALAATDPRTLSRDGQMAYWINLYNALTVAVVLDHPGRTSIKSMGKGFFSVGPWDDALITVAGQSLTLNDIEHGILRPIWQDHRIHFAVNCASLGCPSLSPDAYAAESLEKQLNQAESAYLNHPRGVHFDQDRRLHLSSIFDWYRDDFATDQAGLLRYLADHLPADAKSLRNYQGRISYDYDWRLNGTIAQH